MGTLLMWAIGIPLALFGADVPIISKVIDMVVSWQVPLASLAVAVATALITVAGIGYYFMGKSVGKLATASVMTLILGAGGPTLILPYLQKSMGL